ncbi:MAG: heavy metal translocating P-type ATPase [Methylococcales bacterium]|nr:heavy metal translocating P-type ATPase [Methylococcales bacterium]
MIIELLLLSGIFYTSTKTLKKKSTETALKPYDNKTDEKADISEAERRMAQMLGSEKEQQALKLTNKREITSAGIGLGLATIGAITFPPISFLSVPFLVYSGRNVFLKSFQLIKEGKFSTESLITITLFGAILLKRFFIANLIAFLVRYATYLANKITDDTRANLESLFGEHPTHVWILVNTVETKITFDELKVADIVIVQSSEMIPADGVVINGMASIDQHILTGEANPVEREKGDEVFASTLVLSGKIYIEVQKAGKDCTVGKIADILNKTVDFKSSTQLRSEAFSKGLVTPTLIASALAIPIIGFGGALAVVNAHPKNKIMLIAPLTVLNYLNIASKNGVLIKDGRSLELLNKVDTIVFDKTGTLTETQPHVGQIFCCRKGQEDRVLAYAAAAEYKQAHPLAHAIIKAAEEAELTLPEVEHSECHLGYGVLVHRKKESIHVGSERFMEVSKIKIPPKIAEHQKACLKEGYSLVMVAINKKIIGAIELKPTVRPEVKKIIQDLKARSAITSTYIISGDHEAPTKKLAEEIGIDHYFAETLPTDKSDLIEKLKEEGRFVCYIGDGINDAIALKTAQVSISLSGASTIATDTAQIVLMNQGISHLNMLFDLAEDFNKNMDKTFNILLTPAAIGIGGVFLLGFGLPQTLFLNMGGLFLGMGNAMRPRVFDPLKNQDAVADRNEET